MRHKILLAVVGLILLLLAFCAPKRTFTAVTVPGWDLVEDMGLDAPEGFSERDVTRFEAGWRFVREGALEQAANEILRFGERHGDDAMVATALGYLELRAGQYEDAEKHFHTALGSRPDLFQASAGRFLVALAREDEEAAYATIQELEELDASMRFIERYRTRLQVNVAEARLSAARAALEEERFEEAARAYERALEVAPEVGALHLEAAEAQLAAGNDELAVRHAERAVALESSNSSAHVVLGQALYQVGELERAVSALRRAVELMPSDGEIAKRLEAFEAEYREKNLPEQYADIEGAHRLTREQLAALLYVELREAFDALPPNDTRVIATDIPDSWASEYILFVVRHGVLDVFPNHTFQPEAFVDRIDFATTLASTLELLSPDAYARESSASQAREPFTDFAKENARFPAAALSIELGWFLPTESGGFEPRRSVTGEEAVAAARSLAALVMRVTP